MSFYSYCLEHGKEYLLKEWDQGKNAPLTPESIGSTNTVRVWWKCEKGHQWQNPAGFPGQGKFRMPPMPAEKNRGASGKTPGRRGGKKTKPPAKIKYSKIK